MKKNLMVTTFVMICMIASLVMGMSAPLSANAAPLEQEEALPTIASNAPDYPAGATVTLSGANWQGDSAVRIVVNDDIGNTWSRDVTVPVAEDGTIVDTFNLPTYFVASYRVLASGEDTGRTATTTFTDAPPGIQNLWQCDPPAVYDPNTYTCVSSGPTGWVTGNNDGPYLEGETIPYRTRLQNMVAGNQYSITIEWDTTQGDKHALDYLKSYNATVFAANPCLSLAGLPSGLCAGAPSTIAIPADTFMQSNADWLANGGVQDPGDFSMFGGTFDMISGYTTPPNYLGNTSTSITVTFTANSTDIVMAWGGHIAERDDWGQNNSAVAISGSPYHMRILEFFDETHDDSLNVGNTDRSLSADAVIYPASITIIKEASPEGSTSFPFTASPAPLTNFSLFDDGSASNTQVFANITTFQTYNVTENTPSGWTMTDLQCSVSSPNGGSQTEGSNYVDIALKEGENVTCTFYNLRDAEDLTVEKTATPSFTRTYTWDITKEVDQTRIDIADGETATFNYTVGVTHDNGTDSAWQVNGTITVNNPNGYDVTGVSASDAIDDPNATCAVTGGSSTIAAGGSTVFDYTCTFSAAPSAASQTNTATVTWDGFGSPNTSASDTAGVDWSSVLPTLVDETVDVTDTLGGDLGTATYTDTNPITFQYSKSFSGVGGTCTDYDNTATFTTNDTGSQETAGHEVTVCVGLDLTVEKTVTASYDRTYNWLIEKDVDETEIKIAEGGTATFNYTVTVSPNGTSDSGHTLAGTITVTNPNDWQAITADVTDALDQGGSCTVTGGEDVVIPASDSAVLNYSCDVSDTSATENTATATWDADLYNTPTGMAADTETVSFALDQETDKVITVVDDKTDPMNPVELGTSDYDAGPFTFEYFLDQHGVPGDCTEYTNTTVILETEQEAEATVTLCVGADLTVSKTAAGSFDRTYLWEIFKNAEETEVSIADEIIVLSDGTARAWDATANGTPPGWEQIGFDDSAWSFAQETPCNAYSDWPAPYPNSLWIWYPTCDQTNQNVLLRKHFTLPSSSYSGSLKIHADDGSEIYINGNLVGSNNAWSNEYTYDLTPYLIAGENVIAIKGFNTNQIGGGGGPAGITFSATLSGSYTFHYTVDVNQTGYQDSGWEVHGTINVANPNDWQAITLTGLSDVVDNGGTCTVDPGPYVVPASDSIDVGYNCSYGAPPSSYSGTNTATAEWDAVAAFTPSGSASDDAPFTLQQDGSTDKTINVTDTYAGALGEITATDSDPFASDSFSYTRTESGVAGTCTEYHNTATIVETGQDASDTVELCVRAALTATKTAAGTYDRTVTWTLEKSVDDDSHSGFAGETAGTSTWTVEVIKNEVSNNFKVTGEITVTNPNNIPVDFSLGDVLNDGTVATVTCPAYTVPANGSVVCSYTAIPADDSATLNTATVTSLTDFVGGTSATAPVSFAENLIGDDEVDLADDRGPLAEHLTGSQTFNYDETFTCSSNQNDYTNGVDTDTYPNTATLTGDNTDLSDSAEVTVTCTLPALQVSKTAEGKYDRTVTWTLDKSVNDDSHSGFAGRFAGSSTWTVVADKTETLGNYKVLGSISITNPAAIPQTFGQVQDELDADPFSYFVSVFCPSDKTIDPGETALCLYTAFAEDDSATMNFVRVSAAGNQDQLASAPVTWTENLIGHDSGTLGDARFSYSETISDDTTETFTEEFSCPADTSLYSDGIYQYTETNTAVLNGNLNLSDSEEVTVTCYLPSVSKTALGTYDETHTWTIEKSVDPESQSGVPGDVLGWEWTVNVSETSADSNYDAYGVITIQNPNPDDPFIVYILDTLSNGAPVSFTNIGPDCDINFSPPFPPSVTVPAGGTATCNWASDDMPSQAVSNHVALTVSEDLTLEDDASIVWMKNVIGGTATVTDTEIGLDENLTSGAGPWQFSDTDSHTCSSSRSDYGEDGTYSATVDNTATVTDSAGNTGSDDASTTYTCNASFVDVLKTTNDSVDPTKDIRFKLYDSDGNYLNDEVSTLNDADGQLQFQTALVPGASYTVCESPVPAGYTFEITVDGGNVLTYAGPPGAVDPTGEIQCFDFVAADSPTTLLFAVNNSFPGGAPRTPGYWKNWNTCTGGNQSETAAKLGGVDAGVFLLNDLLPQTVGKLTVNTCQVGVYVLESRWSIGSKAGKQASGDAAYELARDFLAARLNQDAGACVPTGWTWDTRAGTGRTFEQVLTDVQSFLFSINYDGNDELLTSRVRGATAIANRTYALYLAGILDDYNNGQFCTGDPSH